MKSHPTIPETELGLLYGTLLGDFSVSYPYKNASAPRITANHSGKQESYARYKAAKLPGLKLKVKLADNRGFGETQARVSGRCHNDLRAVFDLTRRVNPVWLSKISDEGIAWWFMDDGSSAYNNNGRLVGLTLHTNAYDKEENELIQAWLTGLGFEFALRNYKRPDGRGYFSLHGKKDVTYAWVARFGKYVAPGMEYKFAESNGEGRRPSTRSRVATTSKAT